MMLWLPKCRILLGLRWKKLGSTRRTNSQRERVELVPGVLLVLLPLTFPKKNPLDQTKQSVFFAKSEVYRDTKAELATNKVDNDGESGEDAAVSEVPDPIRIAMEKAREYKKNKGLTRGDESRGTGEIGETTSVVGKEIGETLMLNRHIHSLPS